MGVFLEEAFFKTLDFSVGVADVSARQGYPVKGETYFSHPRGGGGSPP